MAPSEVLPSTPSTGRVAMASLRGYRQGGHTLALGVALDVASRTLDRVSRPTTPRATSDVASRSTMPRAPSDRASRSTIPRTPLGWVSRSTTPRTPSGLSPASSLAAPAEPRRQRPRSLRRAQHHPGGAHPGDAGLPVHRPIITGAIDAVHPSFDMQASASSAARLGHLRAAALAALPPAAAAQVA